MRRQKLARPRDTIGRHARLDYLVLLTNEGEIGKLVLTQPR